jgi:SAM-dependent methyltransferase
MTRLARYDAVAEFYTEFAPDMYDDPPMAGLLQLLGDVTNLQLLDLACGHGRLTRELTRRGAQVVGVDISAALLGEACAREMKHPLHVSYIQADAASVALKGAIFDGVTCSFGLSDIDDLEGAIATVSRVLRPGGFFAFSLLHPCFPGWEAKQAPPSWSPERGYYAEGWWCPSSPAHGLRPRVGTNHRMLSSYLNTFARYRLVMEQMSEPPPPSDWLAEPPHSGPVPIYLVGRCRRTNGYASTEN